MQTAAQPSNRKDLPAENMTLRLTVAGLYLAGWLGAGGDYFWKGLDHANRATARSTLVELENGVKRYERKLGCYPKGDGSGTRQLLEILKATESDRLPCFSIDSAFLVDGNLRNPLSASQWYRYRSPGIHNPKSFDLWCEDENGRADGINNWEK